MTRNSVITSRDRRISTLQIVTLVAPSRSVYDAYAKDLLTLKSSMTEAKRVFSAAWLAFFKLKVSDPPWHGV